MSAVHVMIRMMTSAGVRHFCVFDVNFGKAARLLERARTVLSLGFNILAVS